MIKIPYEEIILKINEKTNMTVSEIEERVDKKRGAANDLAPIPESGSQIVCGEFTEPAEIFGK